MLPSCVHSARVVSVKAFSPQKNIAVSAFAAWGAFPWEQRGDADKWARELA